MHTIPVHASGSIGRHIYLCQYTQEQEEEAEDTGLENRGAGSPAVPTFQAPGAVHIHPIGDRLTNVHQTPEEEAEDLLPFTENAPIPELTMPNYKLTYFNMRGRGEHIRYIFAYMNAEYEDNRIELANWPAIKPSIPYGRLPILEVDGVILHQSLAIGRYLAKKAGLSGKTDLDDAHIDAILDSIDDFVTAFPWAYEENAEIKKKQEDFLKTEAPILLANLEKSLGDKQWFVGDSVSLADFYWDTCSEGFEGIHPGFAKDYPKLQALKERVRAIPAIAAWIKERPETKL